jgi:hypothetical protein
MAGSLLPVLEFYTERRCKTRMKEFRDIWQNNYENRALNLVEQYTGLPWKLPELRITVISSASIGDPFQADVDPKDPSKIRLVAMATKRGYEVLVHELIHSNVWGAYNWDYRFRQTGFFEDVFCDEILTELVSQQIGKRLSLRASINYQHALEYGLETTFDKIADILGYRLKTWSLGKDKRRSTAGAKKLRLEMITKLEKWFRGYLRRARVGETNLLEGRREILGLFPNISEY